MIKQKIFAYIFLLSISFYASCNKKDKCSITMGSPSATEINQLKSYVQSTGLTTTESQSGFLYKIDNVGIGTETPNINSTVTVKYKGWLTNGNVFDSTQGSNTSTFPLNRVIAGWQLGLPLIKKGGVINLYLPPSLGYGCDGYPPAIAGNSILIFRVELLDFY